MLARVILIATIWMIKTIRFTMVEGSSHLVRFILLVSVRSNVSGLIRCCWGSSLGAAHRRSIVTLPLLLSSSFTTSRWARITSNFSRFNTRIACSRGTWGSEFATVMSIQKCLLLLLLILLWVVVSESWCGSENSFWVYTKGFGTCRVGFLITNNNKNNTVK